MYHGYISISHLLQYIRNYIQYCQVLLKNKLVAKRKTERQKSEIGPLLILDDSFENEDWDSDNGQTNCIIASESLLMCFLYLNSVIVIIFLNVLVLLFI